MSTECPVSLDVLQDDPAAVNGLSYWEATALLSKILAIKELLVRRLEGCGVADSGQRPMSPSPELSPPASAPGAEDLLTVHEAAAILRVSPGWLYRHARKLPFSRKLSRKVLRFSRSGMARWLARKRHDSASDPR